MILYAVKGIKTQGIYYMKYYSMCFGRDTESCKYKQ